MIVQIKFYNKKCIPSYILQDDRDSWEYDYIYLEMGERTLNHLHESINLLCKESQDLPIIGKVVTFVDSNTYAYVKDGSVIIRWQDVKHIRLIENAIKKGT